MAYSYQLGVSAADLARIRPIYGTIHITQSDIGDTFPPNSFSILAHPGGTSVLTPPPFGPIPVGPGPFNGYHRIPGFVADTILSEVNVVDGALQVQVTGTYKSTSAWVGFRHSGNKVAVGLLPCIERSGFFFFGVRPTEGFQVTGGTLTNLSGGGTFDLVAGDKFSLWAAADTAGVMTVGNASLSIEMIEEAA
jgi:hypothetical protein